MGQRTKASREAAAAAAPPPPSPPKAPAPAAPAKAATPAAPKAPATGAVTKPIAPKAAAPARPAAPAAQATPRSSTSPTTARAYPEVIPIPGESSFSTAARELAVRRSPRAVELAEEDALRAEMLPRIERVRELRRPGGSGPGNTVTVKTAPEPGRPAREIQVQPSAQATYAPVENTLEFGRQARSIGERYAAHLKRLEELEQLRQTYTKMKAEGASPEDAALRQRLSEEDIQAYTTPTRAEAAQGARPGVRTRKRTPEELEAAMRASPSGADAKLKEVAESTRKARRDAAQALADLTQYGYTPEEAAGTYGK